VILTSVKHYVPNKEDVEAILVTRDTIEEAAKWCGGEIRTDQSGFIEVTYLAIPSLTGPAEVRMSMYLIKRRDGKFDVARKEEFEAEYHVVSRRQDGIVFPRTTPATRGGSITNTNYTQDQTTQPAVARAVDEYVGPYGSGVKFGE
jgi:hypothetical protein